ncbi:MAG: carbohydrate kinase family protein [Candidatus Thorarchaeota archaeon]|nr:carbohydrate kinase family protein [Candidatus Thorarchaeota archaeon]
MNQLREVLELDYPRLIEILQTPLEVGKPVILPDFFIDHFVVADTLEGMVEGLENLAKQGGGNLLGTTQFIRRGGNAANLAAALFSLGIDSCLVATTDEYGASLLRALIDPDFDLSHIHTDGRLSSTVSIELEYGGRQVNLMVSDSGSAADFTFSELTEPDLQAIRKSSLVALLNMNHNKDPATLADELFEYVKDESKATTFLDMGDPSSNPSIVEPIAGRVLSADKIDILSVNENEVLWLAWALAGRDLSWRTNTSRPSSWIKAAKYLSKETSIRVDLHTPDFAATIVEDISVVQPAFQAKPKISCGAGDAWNSGSIYGTLAEMSARDRLILSNAVAAFYIASPKAIHPSISEVISFLLGKPLLKDIDEKLLRA